MREIVIRGARENNLNFYKGKLVVNEQVRRNIAHRERFYVRYDEYLVDLSPAQFFSASFPSSAGFF